jgi:sulfur carrier protein ThiS
VARLADALRAGSACGTIEGMAGSGAAREISVTVTLMADLRRYLPRGVAGPQRYTLPGGSTVGDLLDRIGIGPDDDITAGVNGDLAARGTPLPDGADVLLVSPMEGGA